MPVDRFSLRSVASDRELVIDAPRRDGFTARLRGGAVAATIDVHDPLDPCGLAAFLGDLAAAQRPWPDRRAWLSLETELEIAATCTRLGRVTFAVRLRDEFGGDEDWSASAAIAYELGALPALAREARTFFDTVRAAADAPG